jgi:predicted DNA-binding protein
MLKLARKVEDLEDVRFLVNVLNEVRVHAPAVGAAALSVSCPRAHTFTSSLTRTPTMQVREKEADIDAHITPIEDMYSLLLRYEVRMRQSCSSELSARAAGGHWCLP